MAKKNESAEVVVNEAVSEVTETTEPEVKATTRRKREKARDIETLDIMPTSKMSPKEIKNYVDYLRDAICTQATKIENLTKNIESAYAKCRQYEDKLHEQEVAFNAKIRFIKQAINTCEVAVNLALDKN